MLVTSARVAAFFALDLHQSCTGISLHPKFSIALQSCPEVQAYTLHASKQYTRAEGS